MVENIVAMSHLIVQRAVAVWHIELAVRKNRAQTVGAIANRVTKGQRVRRGGDELVGCGIEGKQRGGVRIRHYV